MTPGFNLAGRPASTASAPDVPPSSRLVFRSVKLPALLAAFTLVLALVAFGLIAWRGMRHLQPLEAHMTAITRLQQIGFRLEELTIEDERDLEQIRPKLDAVRQDIGSIMALDRFLAPKTEVRLAAAQAALSNLGGNPEGSVLSAIERIRAALAGEVIAHGKLLNRVRHDAALELSVAGAAFLLLAGLSAITLIRIRRRVLAPLDTLEQLLALLAKRDYSLAPTENVDPMIQPLTASYNHLVNRLLELEEENRRHRGSLEQEVRTVTEALLEQHRNLAAAERLAATGEVAARIAHELRNPLAGMQMALSNIRAECSDRNEVAQRLDLVIDELRRVTALLNGLLDQSRITPEAAVDLPVGQTAAELLAIVRYRIPKGIRLTRDIPEDLVCHLPKDRLRQVLLNLVLNSADAIGERPGEIAVRAALSDGTLELTVSDNGPGFPPELLREGIGPFRHGRPEGTGLGLSIVSRLVRNLDGRIELSNLEPHGACVRLTLPCRRPNA